MVLRWSDASFLEDQVCFSLLSLSADLGVLRSMVVVLL